MKSGIAPVAATTLVVFSQSFIHSEVPYGVDCSGPPGRQPAGEQRRSHQRRRHAGKRNRVEWIDLEQQAFEHTAQQGRSGQAPPSHPARPGLRLRSTTRLNTSRLAGAERHANPEFGGPLRDGIRDHAVDSESRQHQRQSGEESQHHGEKTRLRFGGAHHVGHGAHLRNRNGGSMARTAWRTALAITLGISRGAHDGIGVLRGIRQLRGGKEKTSLPPAYSGPRYGYPQ